MACGKPLSWVMGKSLAPHTPTLHGSAAWAMLTAAAPWQLSCIPSGSVCFFLLVCFMFFPTAATGLSALPLPVNKLGLQDNKNSVLQKKHRDL